MIGLPIHLTLNEMIKPKKVVYCLLFVLNCSRMVFATQKLWLKNMNFDNADNWADKRLPCDTDVIEFASAEMTPVSLGMPITAQQLTLPRNGELRLQDGFSLAALPSTATRNPDNATCRPGGSRSTFNRSTPEEWFNPNNWCQAAPGKTSNCLAANCICGGRGGGYITDCTYFTDNSNLCL